MVVAVISPIKFHLAIFDADEPMIGNGDAVRVAADIVHHLLWPGERWLGVDDPFHVSHQIEMTGERLSILECLKRREELQLADIEGLLQILQEQSAEQAGEHPYRQEKARAAGDPPGTIRCNPAARDDTMQMRMEKQALSPTVQYGEEADLGAQIFGIGGNGAKCFGGGPEQNAVPQFFVLVCDGGNLFRSVDRGSSS